MMRRHELADEQWEAIVDLVPPEHRNARLGSRTRESSEKRAAAAPFEVLCRAAEVSRLRLQRDCTASAGSNVPAASQHATRKQLSTFWQCSSSQ